MPLGRGRRTRVYGVGAAKTGTHSLGEMFGDRIRTAHEKDAETLINLHLRRVATGRSGRLRAFLRWRDIRHRLDMDASQVNLYLIDDILALWPDSRFVLTYRHPVYWLRSIIDDTLRRTTSPTWHRFRNHRFGLAIPAPAPEADLTTAGLYSLTGYLSYWTNSIIRARQIPESQVLMVRTEEIGPRAENIAEFCGFPNGEITPGRSHSFANDQRFGMLSKVPKAYLIELIQEICGDPFAELFPDRDLAADVTEILCQDTPQEDQLQALSA